MIDPESLSDVLFALQGGRGVLPLPRAGAPARSAGAVQTQRAQTALYVFVSPRAAASGAVSGQIYYRSPCTAEAESAPMQTAGPLPMFVVPARHVCEPLLEYFVVFRDERGRVVWTEGTAVDPVVVSVYVALSPRDLARVEAGRVGSVRRL